ncbi:MAG: gliding motility lipoprotein GldD [Bacteroidia bacterium]
MLYPTEKKAFQKNNFSNAKKYFFASAFLIILASCGNSDDSLPLPKPKGYFRIALPQKNYVIYNAVCPFSFDYPTYAKVVPDTRPDAQPCWLNVEFPQFHGSIHLTYKHVDGNLKDYLEQSRTLAIKHEIKASAITEQVIVNDSNKVYGLVYDIEGNAASPMQFYLTDSVSNFIRGSLYFEAVPNSDSIAPVVGFIKQDIQKMIDSFRWRK